MLIIIALFLLILSYNLWPHTAFSSTSFSRQEITDNPAGDWLSLGQEPGTKFFYTHNGVKIFVEPATNISQCKIDTGNFPSSDIGGVSYLGNNRSLNSTIWLTGTFKEPLPGNHAFPTTFTNDSNLSQPFFRIDVLHIVNQSLSQLVQNENTLLRQNNIQIIGPNITTVAGNPAYKEIFMYNGTKGESCKDCQIMQFLTQKHDRFYLFTYVSEMREEYSRFLNLIQTMMNSVQIGTNSSEPSGNLRGNMVDYQNDILGIRLDYPDNWMKIDNLFTNVFNFRPYKSDYVGGVMFLFPITGPILLYRDYTMFVDVNPTYKSESVAPYVSRIRWDAINQSWNKTIEEWSSNGEYRILSPTPDYKDFYQSGKAYVLMDFDLGVANFPDKYTVFWSTTDQFINNGKLCVLRDTTFPVTIPPPKYSLSVVPAYTKLEPGGEKVIQLLIKSLTDLDSHILLSFTPVAGIKLDFNPKQIDIPASGTANIDIHLNVSQDARSDFQQTVPIDAKISFPPITATDIIPSIAHQFNGPQANIFTNDSASPVIYENGNITLAIHATTPQEHLNSFYSSWISPINGIWTLIASIVAVAAPLIVRFYTKKQNRIDKDEDKTAPSYIS